MMDVQTAFQSFSNEPVDSVTHLTSGHIHHSYRVSTSTKHYVVQALNEHVFRDLDGVMQNAFVLTQHLENSKVYPLEVPGFLRTRSGATLVRVGDRAWRCQRYIGDPQVEPADSDNLECFLVAHSFGAFSLAASSIDHEELSITIPNFHNPRTRWRNFEEAIAGGIDARKAKCHDLLRRLSSFRWIAQNAEAKSNEGVAHNDPKPSNIITNAAGQPLAIIDFDTVMPGSHFDDFGDLVRSMCCSIDENQKADKHSLYFLVDMYDEILAGFSDGKKEVLTTAVRAQYAKMAAYIILEQSLRFVTDYLTGDQYYQTTFSDQNLVRAENQLILLESMTDTLTLRN